VSLQSAAAEGNATPAVQAAAIAARNGLFKQDEFIAVPPCKVGHPRHLIFSAAPSCAESIDPIFMGVVDPCQIRTDRSALRSGRSKNRPIPWGLKKSVREPCASDDAARKTGTHTPEP
jgi:hypothetical protein